MISFIYPGDPVPAVRTTGKMLWTPSAKRYGQYKKDFALSLKTAFPMHHFTGALRLEARFYKGRRSHVDIDNLAKSLMDSIQTSGLIDNDSQIVELEAYKCYDKEAPRVEFELKELFMEEEK